MSPPELHPLVAFAWTSECISRTTSAVLVERTRHELTNRQVDRPSFAVFIVRGALPQSCDVASSRALGSLLEFEPSPLISFRTPSVHSDTSETGAPRSPYSTSFEPSCLLDEDSPHVHHRQTPATQRTALILQRREELPLKTALRRSASAVRRPSQRLFRCGRPRGHRHRSLFLIAPRSGHQSAAASTPLERLRPVLEVASKLRRALQHARWPGFTRSSEPFRRDVQ